MLIIKDALGETTGVCPFPFRNYALACPALYSSTAKPLRTQSLCEMTWSTDRRERKKVRVWVFSWIGKPERKLHLRDRPACIATATTTALLYFWCCFLLLKLRFEPQLRLYAYLCGKSNQHALPNRERHSVLSTVCFLSAYYNQSYFLII